MITLTATITLDDGTEITLDKRNALAIDQSIIDRSNALAPSYGIISNGGSMEMVDYNGEIKAMAQSHRLNDKAVATIYLNNSLIKNCSAQMGKYYATQWSYDDNSRSAKATLSDDLVDWQSINIDGFYLQSTEMSGLDIYNYLKEQTPLKWRFAEIDEFTNRILSEYIIKNPFLNRGNLWRQWYKLCAACGLYIFKNRQAEVVVSYDFRS
jgi:hypothetical protein